MQRVDALELLRRKGAIKQIHRTEKRQGDVVLDSWCKPVRVVKEGVGG